jgi:ubiquinone/menaquinone biosynthesis C-methylase UbiE
VEIGEEHLRYFLDQAELGPDERVLDVGCGIGRMSLPLTRYLSSKGEYYGFDPNPDGIEWCTRHISSRFPNFHFCFADVRNDFYNPRGKFDPENFRFPYDDNFFDFIFATSVFTHLFPDALKNYFSEMSRVLRPGGRSFVTYFLMNRESVAMMAGSQTGLKFTHELNGCWTAFPDAPEAGLAYGEDEIRALHQPGSVRIAKLSHGYWCGRQSEYGGYQDLIIACKDK